MTVRIGIVNDVALALRVLKKVLSVEPDFEIVWEAVNGEEAVSHCQRDRPDVVLMDLVMPVLNGAEATRRIMRHTPCPILLVTSTIEGHMDLVYEALGYGALDVTTTPVVGDNRQSDDGSALRQKIRDSLSRLHGGSLQTYVSTGQIPEKPMRPRGPTRLVLIGASTGGPTVLNTLIKALPTNFSGVVVVAQHIDTEFAPGLAEWLGKSANVPVVLAGGKTRLIPGHVYVLDPAAHSQLIAVDTLDTAPDVRRAYYCPSIDTLFHSAAIHAPPGSVGILLTGIGNDGAEGLKAMRRAGLFTISQSEPSSVVYGMPMAAVTLDATDWVADPDEIADFLPKHIR